MCAIDKKESKNGKVAHWQQVTHPGAGCGTHSLEIFSTLSRIDNVLFRYSLDSVSITQNDCRKLCFIFVA